MAKPVTNGMHVQARCKGSVRWHQGELYGQGSDDYGKLTYDVLFSDGDRDRQVPFNHVQFMPRSSSSRGAASTIFTTGMGVEARCRGGMRWYKGQICGQGEDGMGKTNYDILFTDGDRDRAVPQKSVRSRSSETHKPSPSLKRKASSKTRVSANNADEEFATTIAASLMEQHAEEIVGSKKRRGSHVGHPRGTKKKRKDNMVGIAACPGGRTGPGSEAPEEDEMIKQQREKGNRKAKRKGKESSKGKQASKASTEYDQNSENLRDRRSKRRANVPARFSDLPSSTELTRTMRVFGCSSAELSDCGSSNSGSSNHHSSSSSNSSATSVVSTANTSPAGYATDESDESAIDLDIDIHSEKSMDESVDESVEDDLASLEVENDYKQLDEFMQFNVTFDNPFDTFDSRFANEGEDDKEEEDVVPIVVEKNMDAGDRAETAIDLVDTEREQEEAEVEEEAEEEERQEEGQAQDMAMDAIEEFTLKHSESIPQPIRLCSVPTRVHDPLPPMSIATPILMVPAQPTFTPTSAEKNVVDLSSHKTRFERGDLQRLQAELMSPSSSAIKIDWEVLDVEDCNVLESSPGMIKLLFFLVTEVAAAQSQKRKIRSVVLDTIGADAGQITQIGSQRERIKRISHLLSLGRQELEAIGGSFSPSVSAAVCEAAHFQTLQQEFIHLYAVFKPAQISQLVGWMKSNPIFVTQLAELSLSCLVGDMPQKADASES